MRREDGKPPSLAVITLNAEQQRLVEDLLDKARAEHPELEPFFASESTEPVIVKNLETVQGDERDVVLLGVGYGPDTPGAPVMSMNFGPLNRAGGERRLNVAITRAKREMVVFTSFNPRMIDLSRTSAAALRDLKHFLEFAEQGPRALARSVAGSLGSYESIFEEAVAEGLRGRGWKLVPQVGVSRYRIDLGIVHPDRPGEYLAGVECDGAVYHSAATARDRDKVREAVLRQLGWDLVRVWSTDWWIDRRAALDRLEEALQRLFKDRNSADAFKHAGYRVTTFEDQHASISAAEFFEAAYTEQVNRMIAKIIHSEAPTRDELLVARIARAHGFLRSGPRIRERVLALAASQFCVPAEGDLTFVWPNAQAPALWTQARFPVDDESIRAMEDIALPELAAALRLCQSENRLAETARRFGIKRLSAQARSRLQAALQLFE